MLRSPLALLLTALALGLFPACPRADQADPVHPQTLPAAGLLSSGLPELAPLGLLAIDLDLETLTATATMQELPERTAQAGFESVNLTGFLSNAPCSDCIRLTAVRRLPDGQLALTIGIRHPFPAGDPEGVPSAKNRLDLHVYNVEGVLLVNDFERKTTFPLLAQTAADTLVSNADGFSGNLTPSILGPLNLGLTVYPYRVFFRDYSAGNFSPAEGYGDLVKPRGYMVMPQGSGEDTKTFNLRLPTAGQRRLYLFAQASWGVAGHPPGSKLAPLYRVPQYTKKAASEVKVTLTRNDLVPGDTSSTATVRVQILDTNHDAPVGEGLGEMDFPSQVARFDLEAPGLISGRVIVNNPTPLFGQPRNILNPLTYEFDFPNSAGAGGGNYLALLRVRDSYPAGQTGAPLDGKDVYDGPGPASDPLANTRTLTEYATFSVFSIPLIPPLCSPAPAFSAAEPPDPILGLPYSYQFQIADGTPPFTYELASGTLPNGLTLTSDGRLEGLPATRADFFKLHTFTVRATDSCPIPRTLNAVVSVRMNLRPLTMVYFDIGQGHAALVYSAAGDALLMDTGGPSATAAARIVSHLTSRGLKLKYTVGSHMHEDHIGAIGWIIGGPDARPGKANVDDDGNGITDGWEDPLEYGWPGTDDLMPEKSFDPGNDELHTNLRARIWRAATHRARVPWSPALLGDKELLSLSEPGLELWFAAGNRAIFNGINPGPNTVDENSNSLALILRHGAFDTEVGGDIPGSGSGGASDVETPLAAALTAIGFSMDFMQVHHHGSRFSSNATWLTAMRPEVMLIQCGAGNVYGHPHQELLDRINLNLYSINPRILEHIYMTTTGTTDPRFFNGIALSQSPVMIQAEGDITLVTDGRTYTITTPKGQHTYPVDDPLP